MLESAGFNVIGLDKNDLQNPIDLSDKESLSRLSLPTSYQLIHLAFPLPGQMGRHRFKREITTINANLLSVLHPDRTLFISSTAVYALNCQDEIKVAPWEIYGELKLQTEVIFGNKLQKLTVFRPGTLIEASRDSNMMRFLSQLVSSSVKFVPGNGDLIHPFTHTQDLIQAITYWSLHPETPIGYFDLTASDPMKFTQIRKDFNRAGKSLILSLPIWLLRFIGNDRLPTVGISKWHFRALTYNLNLPSRNVYTENFRSYESIMKELYLERD